VVVAVVGYIGSAKVAPTTATTTGGSATVTVADGTGIVNGDVLTIAGAGSAGADWYATVSSGGGTTTLTMTTTAPASVSGAECVRYPYSGFKFGPSSNIVFINPGIAGRADNDPNAALRYSIDASGANNLVVLGGSLGAPLYDPYNITRVIGASSYMAVRRAGNWTTGAIGQVLELNVASAAAFPTSTQWGDAGYLDIPDGVWAISVQMIVQLNSGSVTGNWYFGVSTATGNSGAGLSYGSNQLSGLPPASNTLDDSRTIANFPVRITSTTRYYWKVYAQFTGTPKYVGVMRAVRVG